MTEFDILKLSIDQQAKFNTVYEQIKCDYMKYMDYKLNKLHLPDPSENYLSKDDYLEDEENEWKFMIYRYLRARKWAIDDTLKAIRHTIQWRMENKIDRLLLDMRQEDIDLSRQYVPYGTHGFTKQQSPIYIEKTGKIKLDKCLERFSIDEIVQGHIYTLELNCRRARQKSRECGKYIETIVTVMDFDGLQLMAGRQAIPILKQFMYIDNNHYPERMGFVFALNTPRFFPIIWSLCKSFVDPETAAKIFILRKEEQTNTLLQYIDQDQLPREYQGTCKICPITSDCIPVYELKENK